MGGGGLWKGELTEFLGRIITMCCVLDVASLLCLPQALCTCSADRLPEGSPGSEPPLVRTSVCRREPLRVYVIKNEHASLPPARRSFYLGWDATAAGWLCDCVFVQLGTERGVGSAAKGEQRGPLRKDLSGRALFMGPELR